MRKFVDKICKCGQDLTAVEPQRIGGEDRHPYSVCPNCGRRLPVTVPVEPEPEPVEPAEPTEPEA